MKFLLGIPFLSLVCLFYSCQSTPPADPDPAPLNHLAGFWLGQSLANWTGLVTEMDKIGDVGEIRTGPFYTRSDWGGPDRPNIWSGDTISDISPVIDFVLVRGDSAWGADDDTDVEYMYQELLLANDTALLTPEMIRAGWLRHIRAAEENYLWVSNQRAFDLMEKGMLPPATSEPANNEHWAMIDAQLTTEIFGLYAPGDVELALRLAELPIRTTAAGEAAQIARFYVAMYAIGAGETPLESPRPRVQSWAEAAKRVLTPGDYPAAMYDFVKAQYAAGVPWEQARDAVYQRYQVEARDGYTITHDSLYCNGCFAAGINFAASLISLFYGEGDFKETVRIGTLCGWDSDNPTATWGGLLGYVYGRDQLHHLFGDDLSDRFWIHRTRQNFPNDGYDDFTSMAEKGLRVRELVGRLR